MRHDVHKLFKYFSRSVLASIIVINTSRVLGSANTYLFDWNYVNFSLRCYEKSSSSRIEARAGTSLEPRMIHIKVFNA